MPTTSIIVTTWGRDTHHASRCLEKILSWKEPGQELIVVVHDETPLLAVYLQGLEQQGKIDHLVWAESAHGHVRGVNLGMSRARGEYVFNINTDVLVGRGVVDRLVGMFRADSRLGLVGWHYDWSGDHPGTIWKRDGSLQFAVRTRENLSRRKGWVDREHLRNIQSAPWSTGRVLDAAGERRILCANTSFFGMPQALWRRIGGFDETRYPHLWADDFLCYAVLDQGRSVGNLPPEIRQGREGYEFTSFSDLVWQGIEDPGRDCDRLHPGPAAFDQSESRAAQLCRLVSARLDLGARVRVIGDRERVPQCLRRHDAIPRSGAMAGRDVDYILSGGVAVDERELASLAPGGAVLAFGSGGLSVLRQELSRCGFQRNRR